MPTEYSTSTKGQELRQSYFEEHRRTRPLLRLEVIQLPRRRQARQILEEIFYDRPSNVEEMIQNRLEEKTCRSARKTIACDFCVGE